MLQSNYSTNARHVTDYLLRGGLFGKVFVDVHDGNKPYIFTRIDPIDPHASDPYNHIGLSGVSDCGTWMGGSLLSHLNDPEYDPSWVNDDTPSHWKVNREKLGRELTALVIGEAQKERHALFLKALRI